MFLSLGGSRRSDASNNMHYCHGNNAVHAVVCRRLHDRLQLKALIPPPPPQDLLDPLRRYYAWLGFSSPFPAFRNNNLDTTSTSFPNYPRDPTLSTSPYGTNFQSSFTSSTPSSSLASTSPWSLPSFVSSTSAPSVDEQALVDSREYHYNSPECVVHQTRRSHIQADKAEGGVWRMHPGMHPHSLEDGVSRFDNSDIGFSGRESWDSSCCRGGKYYSQTFAPRVGNNHDPGAVTAAMMNNTSLSSGGNNNEPLESSFNSTTTQARPESRNSFSNYSNMLSTSTRSPQQSTHVIATQQQQLTSTTRDSFSNSTFSSGSISDLLAARAPQSSAWDHATTVSNKNNNTPFETSSLPNCDTGSEAVMTTRNLLTLRPSRDERFEIHQLAKRLLEDDDDNDVGGELGTAETTFKRPRVKWNDEYGTLKPRSAAGTIWGFNQYMAALAATERVPLYELAPSTIDLASSPKERFDHEEL